MRTTHLGQRSVELETSSPARSLLTLADPWYPQWRVSVDGKPARPLPVDHAFRGVVVPAGAHRVRFSYEDDRLRLGVLLAGLTLAGLAAAAVAGRLPRRRARAPRRGGE
ncbi:MAG TPA: YfhO family protein [Frankiaceae bacterium]|nr:YfhO family protein [Frankiaceae bacterium]